MSYRVINGKLYTTTDFTPSNITDASVKKSNKISFENVFKNELNKKDSFLISNHAAQRLKSRNISFNEEDMKTINDGINKANDKGADECLILYKDVAMVASIKNRTIITAVDKDSNKGNVFTNIDSVVLL